MAGNVHPIYSDITDVGREDVRLLTIDDLAAMLVVSPAAIYSMRHRGEGPPSVKLGTGKRSAVRYRPSDVEAWLDAHADAQPC